jgi:thioredoxin 1
VIEQIDGASFDERVRGQQGPVLVDFTAAWCAPCRRLEPILDELAERQPSLTVLRLDVDRDVEVASRHGVLAFPTLVLFEDGQEEKRLIGLRSLRQLEGELADWLPAVPTA